MFSKNDDKNLINVAALLIHAAKIDLDFSTKEENIIEQTMLKIGAKKENIKEIIRNGKEVENNSNQILEFTKEIKNLDKESKIKIIEELWKIIYSDNNPDIYENNLMRRLTGLLYLDPKTVGDIKEKIKNNLKK